MAETEPLPQLQQPLKRSVRSFWRASGHSNVKKITREVYYRTDIGCGVDACDRCPRSATQMTLDPTKPLLILTVDVLMKQITFCERCLTNCVIPATVSNEVRRRSLTVYARMIKLLKPAEEETGEDLNGQTGSNRGRYYLFSNENFVDTYVEDAGNESPIERDNILIRKCAAWYQKHLPEMRVILLQNNTVNSDIVVDVVSTMATVRSSDAEMKMISDYEDKSIASISMRSSPGPGTPSDQESMSCCDAIPSVTEMTVDEWARELKTDNDDVLEYVVPATPGESSHRERSLSPSQQGGQDAVYPPHLSEAEMQQGLESGRYYSGVLNMYTGSYKNGYVVCGNEEYKISGSENLNRAIHGDNVCVEVIGIVEPMMDGPVIVIPKKESNRLALDVSKLPENLVGNDADEAGLLITETDDKPVESLKKECRVVGILKRNWREYCGSLLPIDELVDICGTHSSVQRVFVPVDARIPFIYLDTRKSKELDKKRVVVVIDSWDRFSHKPSGHWVQVLGDTEDLDTESAVILKEHDIITRDFPISAYKELPPDDWVPPDEEIARRIDFRNQLVFSVDPPNCKDIDDALGYRVLDNGNVEVSVHIADVTHFVKPNSNLDREAAQRCTTVYLVDRRTDMLPSLLTTNLCSLVANQDRLCFSVVWEFDSKDQICNTRFGKGIIRSARAFTYKEAQTLIEENGRDEITRALQGLNRLALVLRKKRFERGAVELESSEVKFEHDMAHIRKMEKYVLYDTNRMVEEFMLLANISVACKINERFPAGSLLRRHPAPVEERMKMLQRSISQHQLDFEFGNSKDLNSSLKRINEKTDPLFGSAVRILTTRCMSQAVYCNSGDYSPEEYKHYGLCADLYTHFTSPIRRYADVIVHRMLAAALDIEAMDTSFFQELSSQCDMLNRRNRNASCCSRDSTKLFAYLFIKKHEDHASPATVISANEKKLGLLSHRFGIEAIANVEVAEYNPQTQSVTLINGRLIKLFDHVNIKLNANQKHFRYSITAELM